MISILNLDEDEIFQNDWVSFHKSRVILSGWWKCDRIEILILSETWLKSEWENVNKIKGKYLID